MKKKEKKEGNKKDFLSLVSLGKNAKQLHSSRKNE